MKPSYHIPPFIPLLLLQTPRDARSDCRVSWNVGCGERSTTSTVTFSLDEEPGLPNAYSAAVVFHWGSAASFHSPAATYAAGETHEITQEQTYGRDGEYFAGYAVTFGLEAGSCASRTFEGYAIVTFDDEARSCVLEEVPPGEVPRASTDVSVVNKYFLRPFAFRRRGMARSSHKSRVIEILRVSYPSFSHQLLE